MATICSGNICRSPMAEVLLQHLVAEDESLKDRVSVSSAGTARWHVGSPMDPRARGALDRAGFHRAGSLGAFADAAYLDAQDLVIVMTREHLEDVRSRLRNNQTEVLLWRNLSEPALNLDVADPYYGNEQDFDQCLASLKSGGQRLTSVFRQRLGEYCREA
ncbi:MAG TPA: low molecular weight protein-tyrosine-phosphatase [Acidimicrobiales bacterium]